MFAGLKVKGHRRAKPSTPYERPKVLIYIMLLGRILLKLAIYGKYTALFYPIGGRSQHRFGNRGVAIGEADCYF